jgi:hypothetical protein
MQARRRPLHCAFGSIPWARMLQALMPKNGPVWTGKKDRFENEAAKGANNIEETAKTVPFRCLVLFLHPSEANR